MSDIVPRQDRPYPEAAAATPVLRGTPVLDSDPVSEGIPLGEYLAALRRYAWLIAATVALSLGFAAYRISRELPRYAASSSVQLVNPRQQLAPAAAAQGASQDVPGWYTDPVLSQIQVLRSRAVASEVVDSLGMRLQPRDRLFPYASIQHIRVLPAAETGDTLHVIFGADRVTARMNGRTAQGLYRQPLDVGPVVITFAQRPKGITTATFDVIDTQSAILNALGSLSAAQREVTNFVDIQYAANDPVMAQRGANAFAAAFQEISTRSAQTMSRRRRVFVEQQLRSTDSLLVVLQAQLSAFRKGVRSFSPRETFRTTEEGLANFRLQRQKLVGEKSIYDQMARELTRATGREGEEQIAALAASPEVATNSGIMVLYTSLVRYQNARDSATTGQWARAGSNPDVQQLDSLIATYRGRLVRAVQSRSGSLAGQIGMLDQVMATDVAAISGLPDAEAEETRLSREVETLQKLVDDLRRDRQEARINEAVQAGQVELVDWAMLPGGPVGSGGKKRLMFALLIGLALGGGGALALDRLNTSIARREDVEHATRIPVISVIPRLSDAPVPAGRLGAAGKMLARRRETAPTEALVVVNDVQAPGSQAYRKLRTHLIFSQQGAPMRTLMVTSPAASEGKTTVTSNLAAVFAQQGLRVVIVDADLRRAKVHSVFGLPRTPGLSETLLAELAVEEATRPSGVENLDVLAAGRLVPHVSELLGGAAMGRLLRELGTLYDLVIVDTPPVMAAADAEILAAQCDALLLVARAGQTDRQSARHAAEQLRAVGARIVGAVLNDPDNKMSNAGQYGYYYEYRNDEKDENA
ncbi:MAG TPA: polysaccharide biosynthesis tyrosine autokinase [Longimicrobium sp.]|uniref:polysaccharide biosynthesis tyrosine autokinase n=1 Tax=Longimicrobium sp. TaxID=2029185 RepID=UPI002ED8502E